MPSSEHEALVAALYESNPVVGDSLEEQRQSYRVMMSQMSIPDGIDIHSHRISGCNADWVVSQESRQDYAILYLHGGGYVIGDNTCYREVASRLAIYCRARVCVLDYRRAPENMYPAALEDSVAAYKSLVDAGYDTARIAIVGDSAGGGLALATLMKLRDDGVSLPACCVCFSPWTDLAQTGASNKDESILDPLVDSDILCQMASMYAERWLTDPYVSPLYGSCANLPPIQLHVGTREILLDDTQRFASKVKQSGGIVEYYKEKGLIHIWPVLAPASPEAHRALQRCGAFFEEYCK